MKKAKLAALALLMVIVVAVVLPFLIPLSTYIPRLEQEVSARLKEPVTIKSLHVALLPLPHATVKGIAIGKTADVSVGSVAVTPDLWSLLSSTKVIRSVDVKELTVTQKGLEKIPLWAKAGAASGKQAPLAVRLGKLRVDNATIKLDKASIGPLDAEVALDESGFPEQATFSTQDGKLRGQLRPAKSALAIEITAKSWQLPAGPPIKLDELSITGTMTAANVNLNQINVKLYGGSASGNSVVSWQRGVQVKGQLELKQVDIQPLLVAATGKGSLSGRLNTTQRISANVADAALLANALRIEGPFNVQNGVLHGIDIQKAATNLLTKESSGQTRFDQLSGYLVVAGGAQHISQLQVRSGVLAAQGQVSVSPRKELSGRINAQVNAANIASANVPLNVSGTVDSPVVLPTGASMAGAAVGTAILGPGVGTSVGAKVGTWAEGIFGSKK